LPIPGPAPSTSTPVSADPDRVRPRARSAFPNTGADALDRSTDVLKCSADVLDCLADVPVGTAGARDRRADASDVGGRDFRRAASRAARGGVGPGRAVDAASRPADHRDGATAGSGRARRSVVNRD
jgi:hypothetical protein